MQDRPFTPRYIPTEIQFQDGKIQAIVYRADEGRRPGIDGRIEEYWNSNLFVNQGMDWLAAFQSTAPGSAMNHMMVGSCTNAVSLTCRVTSLGELKRNTMATRVANSGSNILTETCSFGGSIDGLTSLGILVIGVTNDARSGNFGELRSASVQGTPIVLGNSDTVLFNYITTVGSR